MMRRRLFSLASVTSVLLCLVAASMWALSTFRPIDSVAIHDYGYVDPGGDWIFVVHTQKGVIVRNGVLYMQYFAHGSSDSVPESYAAGDLDLFVMTRKLVDRPIRGLRPQDDFDLLCTTRQGFSWTGRYIGMTGSRYFNRYHQVSFPLWVVILTSAIVPAACFFNGLRKMQRPTLGHCGHCGYNLTANVSGVCPECGKLVAQKVQAIT